MSLSNNPDFLRWARRATHGLTQSTVMVGIWGDQAPEGARLEFQLQIGHCLMMGKPLILIVAEGTEIPSKLQAAATVIEYFSPAIGEASLNAATQRALNRVDVFKQH